MFWVWSARSAAVATTTAIARRVASVPSPSGSGNPAAARGARGATGGGAPVPAHARTFTWCVVTKRSASATPQGLVSGVCPTLGISTKRALGNWRAARRPEGAGVFVSRSPARTRTGTSGRGVPAANGRAAAAVVRPFQARADRLQLRGRPRCGGERRQCARADRGASAQIGGAAVGLRVAVGEDAWVLVALLGESLSEALVDRLQRQLDQAAQRCEVAGEGAGRGGRDPAEAGDVARAVGDAGEGCLVEADGHAPGTGRGGERERVGAQARGELGQVSQDGFSATVAAAGADEPDRPPRGREPVERPGVEVDRVGAVQDERLDVGGMAGGVDRHQVGAVGGAPEIEPLQAERGPHRLDVVGRSGGAVEPGPRPELAAARADPRHHLLLGKKRRHDPAQNGTGQHTRAAGAALIDEQHLTPRAHGIETRRVLRSGGEDRAAREHERPERGPRNVAARHERERRSSSFRAARSCGRAARGSSRSASRPLRSVLLACRGPTRPRSRGQTPPRAAGGGDDRDSRRRGKSRKSDADEDRCDSWRPLLSTRSGEGW